MKQQHCATVLVTVLWCIAGCDEAPRVPSPTHPVSREEHAVLAGSFVSGDTAQLGALLHDQVVVQPPMPDTALMGAAAKGYLLGLAANTSVAESRFHPEVILPEGTFAYEQGIWELNTGSRRLISRYVLRWRKGPAGWRVVLWRWGPFR